MERPRVAPLKGFKALRAYNAFHTLMMGLKMMPAYLYETYDEFFKRIEGMPPEDQEKMIREATKFVELQKDDVEAMACFCFDPNGVPYTEQNLKGIPLDRLIEIVVAVSVEISKIKIDGVTETEKKN